MVNVSNFHTCSPFSHNFLWEIHKYHMHLRTQFGKIYIVGNNKRWFHWNLNHCFQRKRVGHVLVKISAEFGGNQNNCLWSEPSHNSIYQVVASSLISQFQLSNVSYPLDWTWTGAPGIWAMCRWYACSVHAGGHANWGIIVPSDQPFNQHLHTDQLPAPAPSLSEGTPQNGIKQTIFGDFTQVIQFIALFIELSLITMYCIDYCYVLLDVLIDLYLHCNSVAFAKFVALDPWDSFTN